jgi:two-component system sensor histidine kinase KdpD
VAPASPSAPAVRLPDLRALAIALAAIAFTTFIYVRWLHVENAATVATTFLLVILLLAASAPLWTAVTASAVAVLCFNFFFLPPVGTLTIADPQNWVALFAFLAVGLVASNLSARVRAREREAITRRDELARLFDLSRDVLMVTSGTNAIALLAQSIARRFDLAFVAVALPRETRWDIHTGGTETVALDEGQLWTTFHAATRSLEFDASSRTYSGHQQLATGGRTIRLVPLRSGTTPIGLLAATGRSVEAGTLDALAGITAIAVERAQFLDERKAAELMRQSEQLKTALLASIGHDLRTPLTAIRIAATNVRDTALTLDERVEQSAVILSEVERLTRLFQNILEMARIDAGAVETEIRWTHPSEIIEAGVSQVEQALHNHPVNVRVGGDASVQLDPRLTAAALAHVLENAAQYAPPGSSIDVSATVGAVDLTLRVLDRGPGISAADLPNLFERFYRGDAARSRASGTGMGLWIARGLLAVQGGHVWAENAPPAGAQFTMTVPVRTRPEVGTPPDGGAS